MGKEYILSDEQVKSIAKALENGRRLELLPQKDGGVKILNVERHELKVNNPVSKR